MAKTKKTGGKKTGSQRNTASVKSARPAAQKKVQNTAKPRTTKKTGGRKHNGGWLPNFGGKIAGLGVTDVIGAGGGVILGEAGAAMLPQSYIGDGLLLLGAILTAKALGSISITRQFAPGAGIGVGAVAFKNGLNRLTNGGVTNFFTGITRNVSGYLNPAPPAGGNGNGLSGFRTPRRPVAVVW